MERRRRRRRRLVTRMVAGVMVATAALSLAFVVVVVRGHPLVPGRTLLMTADPPGGRPVDAGGSTEVLLGYVDGGSAAVQQWVRDDGPLGLTVTGVETAPPGSPGLIRVETVVAGLHINPGREAPLLLRLAIGHCEDVAPGVTTWVRSITVHYDVLGVGHTDTLPLGEAVGVRSPATCARPRHLDSTGPAPSSGASG